ILREYSAARAVHGAFLAVRTSHAPLAYAEPLRDVIRRVDPSIAVFGVETMAQHLDDAMLMPRLAGTLSTAAGLVALAVAPLGLYGGISSRVTRRRGELGIRLAIGARPAGIVAMIVRQALVLTLSGIAVGSLVAASLTRFAASLLYGVTPADPVTFAVVPVF